MTNADYYRNVRLMHDTIKSMNDEGAYMAWIYTMPDEPTEDDFMYFMDNDDEYLELVLEFNRIFKKYADGGIYRPSPETEAFINDFVDAMGLSVDIIR